MRTNDKVINFNSPEKELMRVAEQKFDDEDLMGSLRIVNRRNRLYKPTYETYMFLADLYDEMEVFDLAINNWFKCLNTAPKSMYPDIYEGLGACYYNYGNEPQAAFYYNKVLQLSDNISTDAKLDIINLFSTPKAEAFKIVYPPEKVDYSKDIEAGVNKIKSGDFKEAIEILNTVDESNSQYLLAQNYVAICYLLIDQLKKAEQICRSSLEKNPDNVQAMSTLAAILAEGGRNQESKDLVEKLYSLQTENPDEIYKIATVCCENRMHKEAYKLFCMMEKQVAFDCTLKFFKAISAFNSGLANICLDELNQLLDINPNYGVAKFYFKLVRDYIESGMKVPVELSYFYRVTQDEHKKRVDFLSSIINGKKSNFKNIKYEDMKEILYWCFDEADGRELALQQAAVIISAKLDFKEFIFEILLNASVNDLIKIEALRQIALLNKNCTFGSVVCGIYKKVKFKGLHLPTPKKKMFIQAYSDCFAKYDMLDEANSDKLHASAMDIYSELEARGALTLADDVESLGCAIYINSGIEKKKYKKKIMKDFKAKPETVEAILEK